LAILGRQECLPHLLDYLLSSRARTGTFDAVQTLGQVAPAQGGAGILACLGYAGRDASARKMAKPPMRHLSSYQQDYKHL
jgi:hypothetical protein